MPCFIHIDRAVADRTLRSRRQGRCVSRGLCGIRRGDHPAQGVDADPIQGGDDHFGLRRLQAWLFILCSVVSRGGRFFIVAILLNRYGDQIPGELEERLGTWVAIGTAVLVLGFYIAYRFV